MPYIETRNEEGKMTEEQRLILTMVQEGRISAEQAERLLAALSETPESDTGPEPDRSSEWAGSETDWDDESHEVLVANIQCHVQDEMSRVQDELRRARDQVQAELHRVMPEVRRAHEEVRRAVGHALVELRRVIS
jgi:polyhydroxyalkanoate synthesis regulator phasin